ncbi:deoxyguanosinetriphosphate triphosphohydrolase [Haematobacter missouriensis]|uniref:Deoxyguanosinetriphosphate triphosphohydrolase-like protein n=1 Tax=Haematobacter missouriensis TaxID=366616 RepID=A0A212AL68_9RHOB|nr:deoxyguanosinetriphosphate triphosphohydrolase [Haematobacter missouriensis]OWJ80088.1 dGTPase [Haematobacter missouriensis]OWJ82126.1 dGTPase [Haematobacter missouriensis]
MSPSAAADVWQERREPRRAPPTDARSPGDVDYARVIHSASFRRLQGKTQILSVGDGDFYRTRLTHSLEVAQIAAGLARQLARSFPDHPASAVLPERSLIEAIGCAHDLGHPPFGHGGEVALNYAMRDAGGFEGNGQTLRIVARLEHFSDSAGANLTRRTLLGLLKYPVAYSQALNPALRPALQPGEGKIRTLDIPASTPPKCYLDSEADVVDWVLAPLSPAERVVFTAMGPKGCKHGRSLHKSLDCALMDLADDIAYGIHDLEDAITLGLIPEGRFRDRLAVADCRSLCADAPARDVLIRDLYESPRARKRRIGELVHHFISAAHYTTEEAFADPLLRYRVALPEAEATFLRALKMLASDEVINSPSVQQLEFKGQGMVMAVFEALASDPVRLLPRDWLTRMENDGRALCDYVAGMTDAHLLRTYERLFAPRMGSVFDRI